MIDDVQRKKKKTGVAKKRAFFLTRYHSNRGVSSFRRVPQIWREPAVVSLRAVG
jgi:hypothetical protein